MRGYATISPTTWQTDIKKLRGDLEAIAVYYHLTTSPHSNMIGLYTLPIAYLSYEIGTPHEGASKGLARVMEAGICSYDDDNEIVWVFEMAKTQVAPRLSPKDNKVISVAKLLAALPICPITLAFYRHYREAFHLADQIVLEEYERAFKAPSEPLRSKEQEQEQKQDHEKDLGSGSRPSGSEGKGDTYTHARESETQDPFDPPSSLEEGRALLAGKGVPARFMEDALHRLMKGKLFPCDIDDWKLEARGEAA